MYSKYCCPYVIRESKSEHNEALDLTNDIKIPAQCFRSKSIRTMVFIHKEVNDAISEAAVLTSAIANNVMMVCAAPFLRSFKAQYANRMSIPPSTESMAEAMPA